MIIKALVENTAMAEEYGSEHGLSLYMETKKEKILFDLGASGLFLQNAEKLGVDIAGVDFLVISHGHYDHGGGLKAFLEKNRKARVYLHQQAFGKYYARRAAGNLEYIGLDQDLKGNSRLVFTGDEYSIAEGVWLFRRLAGKNRGQEPMRVCWLSITGNWWRMTLPMNKTLCSRKTGRLSWSQDAPIMAL